jgi:anti-sigma regulatory factor (Ser/Thr protein kinase)
VRGTLYGGRQSSATMEANRPTMKLSMSVELPRQRASVPMVRHLASHSLRQLGVIPDVIDDIEIALSEVCTNVIDHAELGDSYDVELYVKGSHCEIRVVDAGRGFDAMELAQHSADVDFERGRGLAIVRALMDQVALQSQTDRGTLVTLEKHLQFQPGAEGF